MQKSLSRCLVRTLLPIAVAVSGCASGPPPGPSAAELAGQNAKVILVAPFNIVSWLPPELEGSSRMVSDALVDHLEAHGKTVHRVSFRAGRDLWAASMKEVLSSGKKSHFENAAKVYARLIGEQINFDVLVVPSLFLQTAKMRNMVAKWDGATQRMVWHGDAIKNRTQRHDSQTGTVNIRAASIFAHVIDSEGNTIQSKRRGLEVIEHMQRTITRRGGISGNDEMKWDVEDDKPPINDIEMIRAGVAAVVSPFLPEEVPTVAPPIP
ncbi:MAG: hypothetical protein ABGX04_05855 [Myxococcales bacterium]|nr:hypothetical protein [Myxococcales bacterium]HIM01611.1 hypothetical protein [Myxococcales bacterium]